MFRLLYISTARPTTNGPALDKLLEDSRRANRANGLTGLLIYDGNRFLQYLEGEEEAVRATFARIKSDPRHFAVVTLRAAMGDHRQFDGWDMAMLGGVSADQFDREVERISSFVQKCDALTAAELKGFVTKLAA